MMDSCASPRTQSAHRLTRKTQAGKLILGDSGGGRAEIAGTLPPGLPSPSAVASAAASAELPRPSKMCRKTSDAMPASSSAAGETGWLRAMLLKMVTPPELRQCV